jgi:hypothetical protein
VTAGQDNGNAELITALDIKDAEGKGGRKRAKKLKPHESKGEGRQLKLIEKRWEPKVQEGSEITVGNSHKPEGEVY